MYPHICAPQDGDTTSLESRWSCKPALGSAGATCFINYALAEELPLDALKIGVVSAQKISVCCNCRRTIMRLIFGFLQLIFRLVKTLVRSMSFSAKQVFMMWPVAFFTAGMAYWSHLPVPGVSFVGCIAASILCAWGIHLFTYYCSFALLWAAAHLVPVCMREYFFGPSAVRARVQNAFPQRFVFRACAVYVLVEGSKYSIHSFWPIVRDARGEEPLSNSQKRYFRHRLF